MTFTARGQPIQSETNNVTLEPNESVAVGLAVDTTGETTDGLIDDITVHAKVAEPSSSSGGGGTGGEPTVQVLRPDDRTAEVTVLGANAGQPTAVDLDALRLDGTELTLDGLTAVPEDDGQVSADIRVRTDANGSTFTVSGEQRLAGFVVEHDSSVPMQRVTFRFSVATSYLDTRGIDPTSFTVYRQPDGTDGWTALDTEVVRTGTDRVRFEAESAGFSTFVVSLPDAAVDGPETDSDAEPGASTHVDDGTDVSGDGSTGDEQAEDGGVGEGPDADEEDPEAVGGLPEEQSASALERAVGVLGLLALVGAIMALVRRIPR